MPTQPSASIGANGLPVLVGVNERITTQAQQDYTDTAKAAQQIGGPQGDQARTDLSNALSILNDHPTVSPGLLAGLSKTGVLPQNPLTQTLIQIDAATQAKRAQDQQAQTLAASNASFQNSLYGKLFQLGKGALRTVSTPLFDGVNLLNEAFRQEINTDKQYLTGKVDWWTGQPTQPGVTRDQLGLTSDPNATYASNFVKEVGKDVKSTITYQAVKMAVEKGDPALGSGYFPSSMIGAGAAATAAQEQFMKVPILQNGKIAGYRPYTLFDPLGYVISLGHPESATAQVVSAIGDIGMQFALDPLLLFGSGYTAIRETKLASEATSGFLAAKQLQKLDLLKTQMTAQKAEVAKQFKKIGVDVTQDKATVTAAYQKAVAKQTKLKDQYGNLDINYDALGTFLSGPIGQNVFATLAKMDDWRAIQKLSGGQLTVDQSVALARATTASDAASVIAPYIAGGNVTQRSLESGTVVGRAVSKPVSWVLSKGPMPAAVGTLTNASARLMTRTGVADRVAKIAFQYHTHLPTGSLVMSNDKDEVIRKITDLGSYLKVSQTKLEKLTDDIALNPGVDAGYQLTKLLNEVFDANAGNFSAGTIERLRSATRAFQTEADHESMYWATQHISGQEFDMMNVRGKPITIHSAHLDSELHHGYTYFPDGKGIVDAIRSQKLFGDHRTELLNTADFLNGIFKKSVLMRPAYIARNIIEEQIRASATGHATFLNNPIAAFAAWIGRPGGSSTKEVLNMFDRTRHDVYGREFKGLSSADELNYEGAAGEFGNEYASFMADGGFGQMGDGVMNKAGKTIGYSGVAYGHPQWWDGFSSQVRILHNSEMARMVADTVPGQEMKTVDYFRTGKGRTVLDRMNKAKGPEFEKNFGTTKNGIRQYLFDGVNKVGENVSVAGRISEIAGKEGLAASKIRELITTGKTSIGQDVIDINSVRKLIKSTGGTKRSGSRSINGIDAANKEIAQKMKSAFDTNGNWDNVLMTVPTVEKSGFSKASTLFNTIPEKFFDISTAFEKTSTMGPEWRQSYWDAINRISGAIDWESKSILFKKAEQDLGKLKDAATGKPIPVPKSLLDGLSKKTDGMITRDEAHKYASSVANKHVTDLFYNANDRKLLFHKLRLISPFAQAWENTIRAWGKIAMDHPLEVYKGVKALNWLDSPKSSALYEMTDAKSYYDPNQGFFYSDPTNSEKRFFVPFAAASMNMFRSIMGQPAVTGPYALSASPSSFNFALGQNSIMPGVGPGISILLSVMDSLNADPVHLLPQGMQDFVNNIVFPYGTPDIKGQGVLNAAFLSGNWNKMAGVLANQQAAFASAFAPSMTYLANSGTYNLDNVADSHRLATDGYNMAKWFTFMRGAFGAFVPIPVAMRPEALAKSKDGNTILAVTLYNSFKNIEKQYAFSNKSASYSKFLDMYGPNQIFAIINTTANSAPSNLLTYNMIQKFPDVPNTYPDIYGTFYPDGELSIALKSWQKAQGNFNKMPTADIMKEAINVLYSAAVDQVDQKSIGLNWSDKEKSANIKALNEGFYKSGLSRTISPDRIPVAIEQFRSVIEDPRFNQTDSVLGLKDYMSARDTALAGTSNGVLGSKATLPHREWLADQALEILTRHPQFQKMFYAYFKKELGK